MEEADEQVFKVLQSVMTLKVVDEDQLTSSCREPEKSSSRSYTTHSNSSINRERTGEEDRLMHRATSSFMSQ